MIIRRETLTAVLPATTSDDTRYHLNAVRFEPAAHRVVATDGHVLLIATDRNPFADADFPQVAGAEFHGDPTPIVIGADVVRSMIATMPKKPSISILASCQLSKNGDDTHATIAATDLQAPRVATIDGAEHADFPNYDRVIPSADRPVVKVALAVDVLEAIIKAAKACVTQKRPTIAITFSVPTGKPECVESVGIAVNGTDVELTGVALPCRM